MPYGELLKVISTMIYPIQCQYVFCIFQLHVLHKKVLESNSDIIKN